MSLAFVLDHRVDVDPDGDAVPDGSQSRRRLRPTPTRPHRRPGRPADAVCAEPQRLQAPNFRRIVDAIPKNAVGKLDKIALRAAHALSEGSNL